ncbi:MAG: LysR substrate-binding domain-containing protein [Rhodoferax sp.]|uniref:LysR substrate-binding domain-containing protein n=1 Tax=Rhodoferax sp. TaxID=50421 RepID=UPI003BB6C978|nr:LysR substrate-binding domain-containing protein [Rhodoferax sp.]
MSDLNSHKSDRLPPLHSLHVFEVAARHESFVQAAAELYVTHGAVSRQIRQLEDALGLALFERRNRAVFLTGEGRVLFAACAQVMDKLRAVVEELTTPVALAPLVVSCEPTIAMRWLIPRLPQFRVQHPEFQIHLLAAGGPVDFVRDKVDVALRRNDFKWPEQYHVERIAPEMMGPVCTPAIAELLRTDAAQKVRELHSRTRHAAWKLWQRHSGVALNLAEPEYFEHFYLSLQAANAGLGIAMGSLYMVEDDVRDGRLTAPYGFVPDDSEYVLLSLWEFAKDKRQFIFLEWVRYEMQKSRFGLEQSPQLPK